MKKKFIQEEGSGRNIELKKVQDLQTIPEIPVIGPQGDPPQPEVSKDKAHPLYTPPLRRSDKVQQAPLRYNFIIKNDNEINIIEDDDPLSCSKAIMSRDSDRWLDTMKSEMNSMYTDQA